jgi:hypothetical protein
MVMVTNAATLNEDVSLPRALEVFAIILLSLGTVGSAWSVFQASRWNNIQTDKVSESNAARIESSKQTTIATATIVYDATVLAQSVTAAANGQTDLREFFRQKLYRPEFLTIVDQAVAQAGGDPSAVPNLFSQQTYLDDLLSEPRQLEAAAQQLADEGSRAGENADDYVLVAVILAITLFFAGTASSLGWVPLRIGLLAIGTVTLAIGAAQLGSLPLA